MTSPLLQTDHLTKKFRQKSGFLRQSPPKIAVNSISLRLSPCERLGIVGESGSGKSTLGRLLLGLTPPSEGMVCFEGQDHKTRSAQDWKRFRRQTALVQQNPLSALNPQMTIGEQISEALLVHKLADRAGAYAASAEMLERVGLSGAMMSRYPHQMSGGQRQRVVIARALILNPKLVVFDEAVSALDVSVQAQVVALLRSLWQELDLAYVFITHDLRIVRYLVDRIAVMYLGRIVETGEINAIYKNPLHPYTRALLASVPTMDPSIRNIAPPVKGEAGSEQSGQGCAFRSRCPLAEGACAGSEPVLRDFHGRQVACHRAEELAGAVPHMKSASIHTGVA